MCFIAAGGKLKGRNSELNGVYSIPVHGVVAQKSIYSNKKPRERNNPAGLLEALGFDC